ncbi:MAG: ferrochelatase [Candidatus Sumerlaeaceae bacterium]
MNTSNSARAGKKRVEVLCLTYGEPPTNGWWTQACYSLSILNRLTRRVAPIPLYVMPIIAAKRGRFRSKMFHAENYHSPLEDISRRQVAAIQRELNAAQPDVEFNVRLVLEFRKPYIWTVLKSLLVDPPDELVILPLYVADSNFTSGVSKADLRKFVATPGRRNPLPAPRYVERFGYDERAGKLLADYIWSHCERSGWSETKTRESVLILGAHGTIIRLPRHIESGARETRYLFGLIRKHLKPKFRSVRIGWLNHVLGGTWTFPAVTEAAKESQASGIRKVVYLPFGFVADNGETQLEGRQQLGEFQWDDMLYLPCPNDDAALMRLLAQRVLERLDGPPASWEDYGAAADAAGSAPVALAASTPGYTPRG